MRGRRLGPLACAALLLAGCAGSHAPDHALASLWPAHAARIDSAIASGRFDDARRELAASSATLRVGLTPAWQLRERDRLRDDLERWTRGAKATRDSVAMLWAALAAARHAEASDSLLAAERWASLACAIGERGLGVNHPRTALARLERARVAFQLARVADVETLGAEAERSLIAAYGDAHPAVADARSLLGRSLKNFTGRPARLAALEHYRRALRARLELFGPSSPAVAESYQDIGNLERLCGRPRAALDAFAAALAIRRRALGPDDPEVASTLGAMGMLCASIGDWSGADSLLAAAIARGDAASTPSLLTRAFRLGLLGQVRLQRRRAAEAEPLLREAIALSESAWVLTPRDEGSTVFSGLAAYADLAMALASRGRAEEAFEVLERGTSRTLLERAPGTAGAEPERPVLARLQRVLAPDAAMVSWVRDRFGSVREEVAWACVVRASGPPRWFRLDATATPLPGGAIRSGSLWRELRGTALWPMRLDANAAERTLAGEVSRAWFAPLEPALAGVHHLIVFSPDLVGGGPLCALFDRSGHSLLERYAISYAPSAAFYAMERERRRALTPASAALVVGDPAYRRGGDDPWPPLRGSREEIATVREALPHVQVLAGEAASARRLRTLAQSGVMSTFRVLHLATHTQVEPTRLFESSLVLAPDRPGEPESRLSAREIADTWRLDADLVCLTGCQGALGMRSAAQGLIGFQQAFFRAGARSVLVSLWPVDDAATALLMKEFYRRLPAASGPGARAEALREAQRAVRDWTAPGGVRPYAHPAYWAGFTLVGDAG